MTVRTRTFARLRPATVAGVVQGARTPAGGTGGPTTRIGQQDPPACWVARLVFEVEHLRWAVSRRTYGRSRRCGRSVGSVGGRVSVVRR